jgi:hypothetical protein
MFATVGLAALITVGSIIISKRRNKTLDITYAVVSILEFIDRLCLLGNLWVKTSVFTLAVCFMNLVATGAIGVFFNFLFMSPIYAHSPHFRLLYKKYTCAYQTVTAFSYFGGVNVMRLIPSGFYGLKSMSADLTNWKFYVAPLNTMANFTLIFTVFEAGLNVFCLLTYNISEDVFILAILGLFLNAVLVILQIFKHLSTRAFLIKTTN